MTATEKPRAPIPASWPFPVPRRPVYYGWVVWLVSTLGFLASIPGQTMGMAVFTEPFMDAFALSRTQLSSAYLLGTLSSALLLPRAGRLYDRYGGRALVVAASLLLGAMLVYFSVLGSLWQGRDGSPVLMFALVLIGYFGVRFAGQGVLTSASRNVLMHWFVRRRGLVSGIRGVFVTFGFAVAPMLLAGLIALAGWRDALWILAALVGLAFASIALVLLRDDPESCGLLPDGGVAEASADAAQREPETSKTLAEARRDPVFWLYALSLGIHSMFITAITFHVVAVFAEAQRGASEAFAVFLPIAIISTAVNLFASWLADHGPLKPFLVLMLGGFALGAGGLLQLDSELGYALTVLGLGLGGGLWGVLSNLAFVRNYGLLHVGAISGLNASIGVFASALGPAMFSLAMDWSGTYHSAYWFCLVLIALLLLASLLVAQHERAPGTESTRM